MKDAEGHEFINFGDYNYLLRTKHTQLAVVVIFFTFFYYSIKLMIYWRSTISKEVVEPKEPVSLEYIGMNGYAHHHRIS